jgi:hypothetical protein
MLIHVIPKFETQPTSRVLATINNALRVAEMSSAFASAADQNSARATFATSVIGCDVDTHQLETSVAARLLASFTRRVLIPLAELGRILVVARNIAALSSAVAAA